MRYSESRQIAIELCKQFPQHTARGLARMLRQKTNDALTLEQSRSMIRATLGVSGQEKRKRANVPRTPRQSGRKYRPPKMNFVPVTQAKDWAPIQLDGNRLGVISDMHLPYHNQKAVQSALIHLHDQKIDHLLINGDLIDFYSISRFIRRPSKRNLQSELNAARLFLAGLRKEFSNIPITLKKGNHEARWDHWLWDHAPEIAETEEMDLRTWLNLDELAITIVDDLDLIEYGKLPILHGHELGKGISAPVNPARGAYLRAKHTILVGHHHRTSSHCESNLYLDECQVWSVGCLCDLRPDYNKYGNSNHGFAMVDRDTSGDFSVQNFRISKLGKVRSS